jgi:hypothetical protein
MGKRYAYFRTPHGQPYRGEDGKHAPARLLADLGRSSFIGDGGGVSLPGPMFTKLEPALRSSFVVVGPDGRELNEHDSWGIMWQSINELAKASPGQPIIGADLLKEADRRAGEYYRQPESPYVLVSSLSLDALPVDPIEIRGSAVSRVGARKAEFPLPEVLTHRFRETPISAHLDSSNYLPVKVTASGRSVHDAVENALNALTLLRGLWSLFATFGSWRITMGRTEREPLGVIHSGPVHTLHTLDGQPVADLYWYDPDFTREHELFKDKDRWPLIEKNRLFALQQIAAHSYGRDLESLLIRYAGALDQPNTDLAFLQMWSILEKITDTVGANYDETIRRAVWIYNPDSRPVAKEMLEALRYRRNLYVHSGEGRTDGDQVAYLIKSLIDPHFVKLIQNQFGIASLKDYGEFLALPTDLGVLQERQRRLEAAMQFMTKKEAEES